MKIMAKDSNVTAYQQSPHRNQTTQTTHLNGATGVNHETSRTNASSGTTDANRANTDASRATIEEDCAKIEALAELICAGGNKSAAALLVLMRTLEGSTDPKLLAHTVKHFAFTRCGELNVYEMVDAQIAILEHELLGQV
jgi:hypothetical protein